MEQPVSGMHIAHGLMHKCSLDFELGGGLNRKSHAMTSSDIFDRETFMGQRMKDQKLRA